MKTTIITMIIFWSFSLKAQIQKQFSAHAHIAPSTGAFAGGVGGDFYGSIDYADPYGFAGTGLGIGIEYHHPFGTKGLHGLIISDFIRTPIKRAFRQQHKITLDSYESIRFSSYYNIPITIGLHFEKEVKEDLAWYIQGGGILDVLKISSSKETDTFSSATAIYQERFGLSTSFGFGLASGIVIKDTYIVGLGYKSLGIHNIGKTNIYTYDGDVNTSTVSVQKKLGMLNLTVGIQF